VCRRFFLKGQAMRFLPYFALVAAILCWAGLMLLTPLPGARETLWPSVVLAVVALALSIMALVKTRPLGWARGIVASLALLMTLFFGNVYLTGFQTPQDAARPVAGATLPEITVRAEDGGELKLPTGKPLVLVFFRGFW
jgi:hypothetical protein